MVERKRDGALRATDYKTGNASARPGIVIDGGATLQPVLYALALEKLVPTARVEAGRLYYCTSAGEFAEASVSLGEDAREAARAVADAIREAISTGFLPAAPAEDACSRCDYARALRAPRRAAHRAKAPRSARVTRGAAEEAMRALSDEPAREAIRSALDETLIVEAAAGTGKTTALVQRVLGLLRSGRTTLAHLVAVTFTEKAAGEMKLRLRKEIELARRDPATPPLERARLDASLAELEEAHVGTIHGFCADLLRQRPVQARVDPLFETADEDAQVSLFDEAFERWFQHTLADPPEGVRRVLSRHRGDREASGPRNTLRTAGLALVNIRDFDAPWHRDGSFDRNRALDEIVEQFEELAALAPRAEWKDSWIREEHCRGRAVHVRPRPT